MVDPRKWSRRTLVLLCLLAATAVPVALSACGEDEAPCEDGFILVDGECVSATD